MADLIEQTMYPRESKCYLIPYDLPKIVVKYFNKNYNDRQLFLLCYTSLMIYNSAEWFINVLKKNHLRFDKIEDLDETVKYDSHKSFQLIFSEERECLKESIKGLFNFEDKSFYDTRNWVLSWLNNDNAETENYYFFLINF